MSPFAFLKPPEIIAHRGASAECVENTREAVERAWALGADAVEVDVRLSADGVVVLSHDESPARLGGCTTPVREMAWREYGALDLGGGVRPACLADILGTVPPGKRLYIEVKSGTETVEPLGRELLAAPAGVRVVVMSFDAAVADATRRHNPAVPVHLVLDGPLDDGTFGRALAAGCRGLNVAAPRLGAEVIAEAHARGFEVHAWTVNDGIEAYGLAVLGVDGITTDVPGRIRRALHPGGT